MEYSSQETSGGAGQLGTLTVQFNQCSLRYSLDMKETDRWGHLGSSEEGPRWDEGLVCHLHTGVVGHLYTV